MPLLRFRCLPPPLPLPCYAADAAAAVTLNVADDIDTLFSRYLHYKICHAFRHAMLLCLRHGRCCHVAA